jgi:ATP-dependent RNA helicase DDX52/ROK1
MLNLPNPSKNTKKNLAKAPPKRKAVGGGGRDVGKEEGRKKRAMISASRKRTKE